MPSTAQGHRFRDRTDAGERLAAALAEYAGRQDVTVHALPRGGVPVAAAVARALRAPLDLLVVRKLGVPGHEELAMGAIAGTGVRVLNPELVEPLGIGASVIDRVTSAERTELQRREQAYRQGRPPLAVRDRTALVVDDGLATGATMLAAVRALRAMHPRAIVVATPVASRDACDLLAPEVDRCLALATPEPFMAVGAWYERFPQVSDAEVREAMAG